MVKFDLSIISSIVLFTFTSLRIEDFYIKLLSLIFYIPGGGVYPIFDPETYFTSNISIISL